MAKGERTTASTVWQVPASALLGAVMALIVGYLTLARDLYRDMAALEGRLNQRISSLDQRALVPEPELSGTGRGSPAQAAGGVVNMDDPRLTATTADSPLLVSSPVRVEWSGGRNKVVQVHDYQANGALLFPPGSLHTQSSSGVTISLQPGKYEIKAWVPDTLSFKAAWIEVLGG